MNKEFLKEKMALVRDPRTYQMSVKLLSQASEPLALELLPRTVMGDSAFEENEQVLRHCQQVMTGCVALQTSPRRHKCLSSSYSQTHSLHPVVFSNLKNFSESRIHSCQRCLSGFPFLFVQSIQGKMVLQAAWSHLFLKNQEK